MKNHFKLITLVYLTFLAISCSTPFCEEANCGANGTCNEATEQCDCDDFYEGDNCELELRERFVSTWTAERQDGLGSPFEIAISKGLEIDQIQIQSPGLLQNFTMSGVLTDAENVDIPEFVISIASNLYSGSIVVQDSTYMIMSLDVRIGGVGELNTTLYDLTR